jgi:hypothetical protein
MPQRIGMGTALLVAFVAIMGLAAIMIAFFSTQLLQFVYIVPVIFLFLAIAAFLLILLHYAVTLHELKPNMPVTALGLPEGSVRAFLAIGLMALVAVFGTFIYFGIDGPADSAKADIAKQLLTMITTLLTTVVGFYFGSRSGDGGAPGDLERRATALQQINAAYLKNKSLAETLRTRLADLALKTSAVDPAKKDDADKAVAQLEDQRDRANQDLDAAAAVAASADSKTDDIESARKKAVDAEATLTAVKAKLDNAGDDITKLTTE